MAKKRSITDLASGTYEASATSGKKDRPAPAHISRPSTAKTFRKKPRQKRAQHTVDCILEAARQIFAEYGYVGGTTNRIAERAGVSIGSLYQYFPNKDVLVSELVAAHQADVKPVLAQLMADLQDHGLPIDTTIRKLFTGLAQAHADSPQLHRVLFEEAPRHRDTRELQRQKEAEFVSVMEAALQSRPDVQAKNYREAAYLLVQAMGHLSTWLMHEAPEEVSPDAFVDECVIMLNRYLSSD